MAVNKAKVAVGFIVVGVLAVLFGTILTFVGPIIIDDQIVKVGRTPGLFKVFALCGLSHLFVLSRAWAQGVITHVSSAPLFVFSPLQEDVHDLTHAVHRSNIMSFWNRTSLLYVSAYLIVG